ncbi:CaiB/BaiF CoA-transferase family protein [Mesorhizobium sp. MSK_1335]|uniref:CaiB/BaiF CoA-transferase family protein n=1 Tax=Mesorhizobium montanum TaxID=3072323 RepID=A0ABU4ZVV5_9HYPH|nr:CaiB/BaiF CoA-transferase family protein [Mesorhizobium sp. MSK_1335]MDX8529150.1 CaiB/BaiF CoA-transferase family protein [Mesorhizobium sp. MSK_1335]
MNGTKLPLDGIKVLDLTRVLAGPWLTMSLGDLGAEVWKIENLVTGDDTRAWSVPNYNGISTYYLCANRGKQSLAVDLKSPEGREIVLQLAAKADVVVENFRAGTMTRLGIGYETLQAINPALIFCSISGYGQTGPESDRAGYDFIMQAESGLMSITGMADGPPNRLGVAFTDVVAGMVATQSVLAALYQRHETGKGQFIDVALIETTLNMLINVGTGYLNAGVEGVRYGNAHPSVVPYQLFECSDGAFALAVGNDRMFKDFCNQVIGRPDLANDPRFMTAHHRALNRDELLPAIREILRTKSAAKWLAACRRASVPAGPVHTVSEALASPTVIERGIIQSLQHGELGTIRLIRPAHGLAAQKDRQQKAPPLLGEDTRAVLRSVLGYDDSRIDRLAEAGVVHCHRRHVRLPGTDEAAQ